MRIGCFSDFIYHPDLRVDPSLQRVLLSSDLNCLSLEAPIWNGRSVRAEKGISLYQLGNGLSMLNGWNFAAVNLANNHIFDFGLEAFDATRTALRDAGISFFGAGADIEEATRACVLPAGDRTVGFWGFAWDFTEAVSAGRGKPGTAPLRLDVIRRTMRNTGNVDVRVVYFHFGIEYEDFPDPYQKHVVETVLEEGLADVVIGTHPHCTQGWIERRLHGRRSLGFYSLGNFVLPECLYDGRPLHFPDRSRYGYGVLLAGDRELEFELVPYQFSQESMTVDILRGEARTAFEDHLHRISSPLSLGGPTYIWFYARERRRKYLPLFTQWERVNAVQSRLFRGFEKTVDGGAGALGLRDRIRNVLRRGIR